MKTVLNKQQTIIAFIVLVIYSAMVGVGVWFYYTEYLMQDENCITVINESKAVETEEESNEEEVEECEEDEVTIAYERAGLFEGTEKSDIETKIIEPYIYYMNNVEGSELDAVVVDKYPADERPAGYWFSILGITYNGGTNGWLEGSGGVIDYWKPECMETCQLTQAYVDAYPNNLPADYDIK
jgi:hypothetical protein